MSISVLCILFYPHPSSAARVVSGLGMGAESEFRTFIFMVFDIIIFLASGVSFYALVSVCMFDAGKKTEHTQIKPLKMVTPRLTFLFEKGKVYAFYA